MRHQEVHGDIFAVHVFVDFIANCLRQPVGVKEGVVLVEEGSAGQHHLQLKDLDL